MLERIKHAIASHPRYVAAREFFTPPAYDGARLTAKKLLNLYLSRFEELRGSTTLRSYPIKLTVEASNVCNLRCPACFTGAGELGRRRSSMSLEVYRKLLAELGDYLFAVDFYNWGEPLLCKHLDPMIEEATGRGISTTVSTNFSFPFDADRADRLVASGLRVLGVSIDGARQESYEQYRVRGNLETVLRNCRLVAAAKEKRGSSTPRLVWEYHVFPHNIDDVGRAQELAREIGMEIAITKGWVVGEEWDPSSPYKFFWYPTPPARCRFLWQDAVVHNDGGVAPCCGTFYKEDDVGRVSVARDDGGAASFREVWNGAKMRQARQFFHHRNGGADAAEHVCYDCPLTVIWDRWQRHVASGSPEPFQAGYGTNDCFNYFWNRRPSRVTTDDASEATEVGTPPARASSG